VRLGTGRHRRTGTLSVATAVVVASGAGGVYLGLSPDGASAAGTTVTVSTSAQLESAVGNAAAGTTIQVRGGTYYPTRTLKSAVRPAGPCSRSRTDVPGLRNAEPVEPLTMLIFRTLY
jgi:hypothetical protein